MSRIMYEFNVIYYSLLDSNKWNWFQKLEENKLLWIKRNENVKSINFIVQQRHQEVMTLLYNSFILF